MPHLRDIIQGGGGVVTMRSGARNVGQRNAIMNNGIHYYMTLAIHAAGHDTLVRHKDNVQHQLRHFSSQHFSVAKD